MKNIEATRTMANILQEMNEITNTMNSLSERLTCLKSEFNEFYTTSWRAKMQGQDKSDVPERKMMKLKTFEEVYDIDETTATRWAHSKTFPAYKLGGRWYVDIPKAEKWFVQEHANNYKYA